MIATLRKFEKDLNDGKVAPIYVLFGEEDYAKERFLKIVKTTLVDPSMADFNLEVVEAGDVSGIATVDKAGQLPMMSDRRVVIVRNCNSWNAKDLKALVGYLDQVNDRCCLVLEFESIDMRLKFFKTKSPHVSKLEFKRPRSWELPEYLRGVAADMGLKLSADAISEVAEMVGDDISKVHRELDKLGLYKHGEGIIEAEDVAALLGRTRQVTRWELNDFIADRNLPGALMKIKDILDSGDDPLPILSSINSFLKQLFTVKTFVRNGIKDKNQLSRATGLRPFLVDKLLKQQRNYSDVELRMAFEKMHRADSRLKSSGMKRDLLIFHLVSQILPRGPWSPPSKTLR